MASSLNDPKLLYAIPGVSAYHIANGVEESLTPAGPQTLSLLMVPTASPFSDLSIDAGPGSNPQEEDFYLHLHLPPELDLPLPATTQIYHQPPSSYLIPRWDLGRNSGVFTRIEFPLVGSRKGLQEDVDTFETILAQCTAFLERAPPPKIKKGAPYRPVPAPPPSAAATARETSVSSGGSKSAGGSPSRSSSRQHRHHDEKHRSSSSRSFSRSTVTEDLPPYNPAAFKPGEAYAAGSHSSCSGGQIVLIDEEDGSVIGELGEGFQVIEDKALTPGSKEPVEITLPTDAIPSISVAPAAREDVQALHPAYKKSTLVTNAVAASRLIVATSEVVSRTLQSQADNFARKAEPSNKPITFKPTTHEHIRRINTLSSGAASLSAKAVGQVGKVAQNLGASLAGHKVTRDGDGGRPRLSRGSSATGYGPDGEYIDNFKPGLLNKSLMAFSTVADGIEQAGKQLLDSSSAAATTVATHKWGNEAGEVTRHISSGIKNVGLVYIDVTGVSRRAIIKSVAKGMVVGHVPGGGDLIVGGDSGSGSGSGAGSSDSKGSETPRSSIISRQSSSGSVHGSVSGYAEGGGPTSSNSRSAANFSDKNPYRRR